MNIFLGLIILLWAIALGATSTYFSVTGLALTIYSGALLPVIIMGAGVEGSKFLIVAWLHTYWHKLSWSLKLPSLLFVACIMVLTSSGVFAFLSKAHNSSTEPTESFELKIEQIENQITLYQKDLIRYQKQLDQLDKNIDKQIDSGKTTRDQILVQQQRDKQKLERDQIYGLIEKTNQKINELQNQKFDNKQNVVNLDLKLAPVKAIASVIGVDANEHAVNFVNAWFVLVFDPVAIFMVIMAQYCFTIRNREKKLKVDFSNTITDTEQQSNLLKYAEQEKSSTINNQFLENQKSVDIEKLSDITITEQTAESPINSHNPNNVENIKSVEKTDIVDIPVVRQRKRPKPNRKKKKEDNSNISAQDGKSEALEQVPEQSTEQNQLQSEAANNANYLDTVTSLGTAFQPVVQPQNSQIINTTPTEQINVNKQTASKTKDNQQIVEKLRKDQKLLKELMDIVSQAVPQVEEQNNNSKDNWLDKKMFDPKGSGV